MRARIVARDVGGASRLYLESLFSEGSLAGLSDGQLLERFASGRGDAAELAFAALVERHGPLVLRACRGILRDGHEAMDVAQATFLVLARKAHSLWVRDSLGPWLHRVACRAAGRARAQATRRQAVERRLAEAGPRRAHDPDRDDLIAAVHEEVDGLPERYRAAIILCDLEGRTCEEAARHLGCPIGTIGSRLARGRERLRGRLARRGLAPIVGAMATSTTVEASAAEIAGSGFVFTARLGRFAEAGTAAAGASPAAAVRLAEDVIRSLFMAKLMSVGAAAVAVVGLSVAGNGILRSGVGAPVGPIAQDQPLAKADRPRLDDLFPFMNDPERKKDFRYCEIGNLRPLVQTPRGVAFQSREAILYQDGTAKLWSLEKKDPVAPPLRHRGPIRELTFFDEANLLVTASDESIKVWDALTGAFRKELEGQRIRPKWLSFAPGPKRFVTIGDGGKSATVWDASALTPVGTLRISGGEGVAAGLSGDGRTVALFRFGGEASVELWDVPTARPFATLRPPSPPVAEVFTEEDKGLSTTLRERGTRFWQVVRSLSPSGPADKPR